MSKIVAYKLSTGEEVVGEESYGYTLKRPRIIQSGMTEQGLAWGLYPFMVSDMDGEISFNPDHIITVGNPSEAVQKTYLQQTSGIQIATTLHG